MLLLISGQGCHSSQDVVYKELDDVETEVRSKDSDSSSPGNTVPASLIESAEIQTEQESPSSGLPSATESVPESSASAVASSEPSMTKPADVPATSSPESVTPPAAKVLKPNESENSPLTLAMMKAGRLTDPAGKLSPAPDEVSLEPRTPKLLIPEKSFRQEGPEGAVRVTFDDIDLLKVLNMEPVPENAVEMFPHWLRQLDGKRVLIRGFMFPTLTQTGITYFQHVRDNEICWFGRTPKVYDRISTVLRPGKATHYIQGRPFDVVGTLRLDPVYEDGEWLQLYLLEDALVLE